MKEYRIIESNGHYDPQKKVRKKWKSLLRPGYAAFCTSLKSAKTKIEIDKGTYKPNVVYTEANS